MNIRIAKKIIRSGYYFDVWYSPKKQEELYVPHSGKHWFLYNKAVSKIGDKELIEKTKNYFQELVNYLES